MEEPSSAATAEDLHSDLLGIQLSSDSDSEGARADKNKKGAEEQQPKRGAQSEAEFQEVRKKYMVKVENGEIWKNITLPLGPNVVKPDAQALVHAVEELYFFRRFAEGAQFVKSVLDTSQGNGEPGLDEDTRKLLRYYEIKCVERARGQQ